jgi:DNA-binding LacI/PurR family transcriptional regulator
MYITRLAEADHWNPRVFTYRSLDDRQVHDALGFCDALVVLPTDGVFPQETVELFRGSSIPTVFIGLPTYGLGLDSVIGEPERDVDLAMDHLEQLGHRRIAFAFQDLGGKPSSGSPGLRQFTSWQQRILKKFDKEEIKRLSIVIDIPAFQSGYKSVYEKTRRCLQENISNPVTGIIVPISNFWPLVAAVQDLGLKIPEDVSVVAIGERNETEYYRPVPTTVFVNIEEHMQMAWNLITEKLENPNRPARNAIIKPQLIAGQTTGPVRNK